MEAVGVFFLVFAFGLSGNPLALGLVLAALIYGGLHVSGAHYNAAVSFAYLIKRKINFNTFIGYVVFQALGAFAAAGLILYVAGEPYFIQPPYSTDLYQQGIVEMVMTFVLVFAYLNLTTRSTRKSQRINGLAIGLTYAGTIYVGQVLSGGIYNPTISFGTSAVDFLAVRGGSFTHIPLYTLGPLAGAGLAALAFSYFND